MERKRLFWTLMFWAVGVIMVATVSIALGWFAVVGFEEVPLLIAVLSGVGVGMATGLVSTLLEQRYRLQYVLLITLTLLLVDALVGILVFQPIIHLLTYLSFLAVAFFIGWVTDGIYWRYLS